MRLSSEAANARNLRGDIDRVIRDAKQRNAAEKRQMPAAAKALAKVVGSSAKLKRSDSGLTATLPNGKLYTPQMMAKVDEVRRRFPDVRISVAFPAK
jgi:hypothetical protein